MLVSFVLWKFKAVKMQMSIKYDVILFNLYNIKRRMGELLRVQEIGDPARRLIGGRLTKRKIIYKY